MNENEITHDNGNIVTFSDGTVVSRQEGTVTYRNWPDVMLPTPGQSRHLDAAWRVVPVAQRPAAWLSI